MHDAFISYSSRDKATAKQIATSLMEKGVNVWFDRWEMKPGESLIDKISEAIHGSSYLFALLSPESVSSNWVKQELHQAMTDEIHFDKVKVVPILIQDCQIPLFLKDKLYVNFADPDSYDYNVQKLVDLVFENPRTPDRPQFGKALFDRYDELLLSKDPDREEFAQIANRVSTIFAKNSIPSHEIGYPEGSYFKLKSSLAEVNLSLNRLNEAAEAYDCAYTYAFDREDPDLLFEVGIPRFCVLCFMNKKEEAEKFMERFYSDLAELTPDDSSINFDAILEYTVRVCFYENVRVENPLKLIFDEDHHLLNLRLERTIDTLFKEVEDQQVEGHSVYYVFARMLENWGILRLALKYYKRALVNGDSEAERRIEQVKASQEGAMKMAPFFSHGVIPDSLEGTAFAFNIGDPRSLTRTLMCSGIYFDASEMVQSIQESFNERDNPQNKIELTTNGSNPVQVIIFEDSPGSARIITNQLADMKIGAICVQSNAQATAALSQFNEIKLYVSDHHFRKEGGLISITGVLYERDVLKKTFPGIKSTLLTNNPHAKSSQEDVSFGFKSAGGDFITDCKGKTDLEIASELKKLLKQISE